MTDIPDEAMKLRLVITFAWKNGYMNHDDYLELIDFVNSMEEGSIYD